jgi:hypothetical protein
MLGVLLGECERDRVLQARVLIDAVQVISLSEPLGERVGGIPSPHLAEACQARDIMSVRLHVHGAGCGDNAIAYVFVTNVRASTSTTWRISSTLHPDRASIPPSTSAPWCRDPWPG